MEKITSTDEVNKCFPRGTRVRCIVRSHIHFGYFVSISGVEIRGLIETVGPFYFEKKNIPEIGSEIEAVIIQFRDSTNPLRRQFRLTTNPDAFDKSLEQLQASIAKNKSVRLAEIEI